MLGQVQIAAKTNEIPALRDLLDGFPVEGTPGGLPRSARLEVAWETLGV